MAPIGPGRPGRRTYGPISSLAIAGSRSAGYGVLSRRTYGPISSLAIAGSRTNVPPGTGGGPPPFIGNPLRVSQLSPEIAAIDIPGARVSQLAPEVGAADSASARVSQFEPEVGADDNPSARVSWFRPEVAHADTPGVRVSGFWVEYAVFNYYQPPVPQILPSLPALAFPVNIAPRVLNAAQQHVSGREVRAALGSFPIWEFTIEFDVLRGTPEFAEYVQMLGFFFAQLGSQKLFAFRNPRDNEVTDEPFITTNGRSVFGPLMRTYCGSTEPVGYVDTTQRFALYEDGNLVDSSAYFVLRDAPGNQLIKFRDTPPVGKVLTVDMSFYYMCRFADDTIDVEEFMRRLYALGNVKLIAPRPRRSAAGAIFGYVTN